tara:strand:- start:173635 stop:174111 length:477 start_codon:yes stop_codon:yes gene_type:complete
MHFKQSKSVYIFIAALMNIPTLIAGLIILGRGWDGFIETGMHQAFYLMVPLMIFVLLALDKSLELKPHQLIIRHMRVLKKVINVEDIRFVRLGSRMANGIPTFIFVVHSKNDTEKDDDYLGKRAMFVDLNFKKTEQEKIYKYFEEKGLLKDRKRHKYK